MKTLFHTLILRYANRHRLIALFNILSIALGVSVYLAVQIANHSAKEGFRAGIDVVAGKSHLEVRSATGPDLDETLYPAVRATPGVKAATPLSETYVVLPDFPGEYLRILGIDLFSNTPFLTRRIVTSPDRDENDSAPRLDIESWLSQPAAIAVSEDFAETLGLDTGDTLAAEFDGQRVNLTLGHLIRPDPTDPQESAASKRTAIMDIGWAQECFATQGNISSIQVLAEEPSQIDELQARLRAALPDTVTVAAPSRRSLQVQTMLDGFSLNLTAMSMVSILVGVFLIYNTVSASVVRRRREIGILRATGASRPQIMTLFISEAFVVGALGILVGLPAGVLLAGSLVGHVTRTVSNLYILVSVENLFIHPLHVAAAVVYGAGATIAGAWLPALEASHTNPVNALHPGSLATRSRFHTPRLFAAGLACGALAAWTSWQSLATGPAFLSFVSCLLVIIGFSLAVPALCQAGSRLVVFFQRAVHQSVLVRVASENFARSLHRNAPTVAALMAAIAMMVGVSVMVSSFRSTVAAWVNQTMVADIYIGPASNQVVGLKSFLPDPVLTALRETENVTAVDTYREQLVSLADNSEYILAVVDAPGARGENRAFLGGNDDGKRRDYFSPGHVILSEALARKTDRAAGDVITIPTPSGPAEFRVAGVVYDYLDDRGRIMITRENYERHWPDPRVHSAALYLEPGAEPEPLADKLRARFSSRGEFSVFSNASLRTRIFEVFDQTFAITFILRTIAIAVAVIGIILSLTTLVMERRREIAIWRAIGASRAQVRLAYLAEAGLVGLFSSIIGLLCGLAMAMVLTWVVNKAFFGWTIQFEIPWATLAWTPLWVCAVSLAAGLMPAARAGHTNLSQSLRTE